MKVMKLAINRLQMYDTFSFFNLLFYPIYTLPNERENVYLIDTTQILFKQHILRNYSQNFVISTRRALIA